LVDDGQKANWFRSALLGYRNAKKQQCRPQKRQYRYWRGTITYSDNEQSFQAHNKAESYGRPAEESTCCEKALVEPFSISRGRPWIRSAMVNCGQVFH
jgi:hypothetical protein